MHGQVNKNLSLLLGNSVRTSQVCSNHALAQGAHIVRVIKWPHSNPMYESGAGYIHRSDKDRMFCQLLQFCLYGASLAQTVEIPNLQELGFFRRTCGGWQYRVCALWHGGIAIG